MKNWRHAAKRISSSRINNGHFYQPRRPFLLSLTRETGFGAFKIVTLKNNWNYAILEKNV